MSRSASLDGEPPRASRAWVWLQLVIAWLPVWAMYTFLIVAAHGGPVLRAAMHGGRAIAAAALLGTLVLRLVDRLPWPRHISASFVLTHLAAAFVFSAAWVGLTSLIASLINWRLLLVAPAGVGSFLVLGLWLYVALTGILYAVRATARAGRAEAAAVESQLAALRSQLNPHFLFNALHTVVQLIPVDPSRASDAAEALAGLLRTAIAEDRDVVPLREERAFVERYLALERIRFADRLQIAFDMDADTMDVAVPAFALQTLVENAVRHGAAPHVDPTRITISARLTVDEVVLTVIDTGVGARSRATAFESGTGLKRLRARLDALFGDRARLEIEPQSGTGFTARVVIPNPSAERG
jgi:two-component system, LytTR family, sensor kinase